MKAEIIATGREILSGDVLDTNTNFLTKKLNEAGIDVTYHHTCGDDEISLSNILIEASKRSDLIIVSGGLGPTEDDKTRKAASIASKSELLLNKEALNFVENYFIKRDITMPNVNQIQAVIPKNSTPFNNEFGTAPGFFLKLNNAIIYFLPGVPYELKKMTNSFLIPDIKKSLGIRTFYLSRKLTLFGLPESEVGSLLLDFYKRFPINDAISIELGIQAVFPHIFIKIYSRSDDEELLESQTKKAVNFVRDKLANNIISNSGKTLGEVCGDLLLEKQLTLSVAESCTGGLIGNILTNNPGSSNYFKLCAVTYSNEAKSDILGVDPYTINKFGAVSLDTAKEMANGVRLKGKSDIGISTTGIAGPTGGVVGKSVGFVCMGVSTKDFTTAFIFERDFKDRLLNKQMFAAVTIHNLIKLLKE